MKPTHSFIVSHITVKQCT